MSESTRKVQPSRAQWLRRLAQRRRDRVAFVFSGGGPLGALQVGTLKALFEYGVRPDLVVGTSVGSLNAAFVAFDPTLRGLQRLEDLWRGIQDYRLFPGARSPATWAKFIVKGDRVFDNDSLRRVVEERFGAVSIESAQIPLGIVTTELQTGTERTFTSGPIIEPLLASCAMPGIYPPVAIDGMSYIDGGVANSVPVAPAIEMGARTVYVLNSTSQGTQNRPLVRPLDYLLHAFTLARTQRLAIEQSIYADKVRLISLPVVRLDRYVSFVSLEHTDYLIDSAYRQTKSFLSGAAAAVVENLEPSTLEAVVPKTQA